MTYPDEIDGISVAPSLYGILEEDSARSLFAMEFAHAWDNGVRVLFDDPSEVPASTAVIRKSSYYISEGDREELYDLDTDPEYTDDRAATSQQIQAFHRLVTYRSQFRPQGVPKEIDKELENQLRTLGYIR